MFTSPRLRFVGPDTGDGGSSPDEPVDETPNEDTADENDAGFPEKTPIEQMTAEEQAAYWKAKSRKHEKTERALRKALGKVNQPKGQEETPVSDQTPNVEDQIAAARTEASHEAAQKAATQMIQLSLAGTVSAETLQEVIDDLDINKFITDENEVALDRIEKLKARHVSESGTSSPEGESTPGTISLQTAVATARGTQTANSGVQSIAARKAAEIKRLSCAN